METSVLRIPTQNVLAKNYLKIQTNKGDYNTTEMRAFVTRIVQQSLLRSISPTYFASVVQ